MSDLGDAWEQMETILEEAIDEWELKRQDYGGAFLEMGAQGQYSEMYRKVAKLRRSVWDGHVLRGEDPEKIAAELIPHCLMMIYCLRNQNYKGLYR